MTTEINNAWILAGQRNGVDVERAFAGIYPLVSGPNNLGKSVVEQCIVYYHERELYPNGEVIKTELKSYKLEDLAYTEVEGGHMNPLPVLTGFVNSLGYPGIINPARTTLSTLAALPLDAPNGYPLHLNTRQVIND